MKRIAIVGAGAIGGSIGAYLLRKGFDITLIDQWAAHIEKMNNDGLRLTDLKETFSVPKLLAILGDLILYEALFGLLLAIRKVFISI